MKEHKYQVIATTAIVNEMAKYDEATAERGEFVRLGNINPITDEATAIAHCRYEEERTTRLYYHWTLTSRYPPTVGRWASFGVKVEVQGNA